MQVEEQLTVLLKELKTYDSSLLDKDIWIVLNKIDTLDSESEGKLINIIVSTIQSIDLKSKGVVSISGFTGNNVNNLLGLIANEMNIKEA